MSMCPANRLSNFVIMPWPPRENRRPIPTAHLKPPSIPGNREHQQLVPEGGDDRCKCRLASCWGCARGLVLVGQLGELGDVASHSVTGGGLLRLGRELRRCATGRKRDYRRPERHRKSSSPSPEIRPSFGRYQPAQSPTVFECRMQWCLLFSEQ